MEGQARPEVPGVRVQILWRVCRAQGPQGENGEGPRLNPRPSLGGALLEQGTHKLLSVWRDDAIHHAALAFVSYKTRYYNLRTKNEIL